MGRDNENTDDNRNKDNIDNYINGLKSSGPSGARLLIGGPSGLTTLSFVPYGRSSRVTQGGRNPELDGVGLGQAYFEVGK